MADPKRLADRPDWSSFVCKVTDMTKTCRPTELTECHREKIREAYSEESKCSNFVSSTSTACPCIDESCKDNENYVDEKGYFCDTWIGDNCTKAQEEWGYSWTGTQNVIKNCKRSCGFCPWLDPCPYSQAPSCKQTSNHASTQCRACRTDKTSGLDIEGFPMQCSFDSGDGVQRQPKVCLATASSTCRNYKLDFLFLLLIVMSVDTLRH
eukprot:TRINITY_DN99161_c0_g1_i1.p1 TRINITY_DN99161_c0_g1~~TRINITY_DN99161_c0_g1_i1.p1  ORF type:complete len:229 (+),score=19.56 TRINITY_DN99161_c0_g1_i1:61-687(+)